MRNDSRIGCIWHWPSVLLLVAAFAGCGGSLGPPPPPNPVPSITSLSPSSVTNCGSGFTLTVAGMNFIASSTLQWNGSNRATTYVSATNLTASITASDVAASATASITVVNPAPGGGISAAADFSIGCSIQIAIDSQAQQLATVSKDIFGANLTSSMDFTTGNSNFGATVSTLQGANFGMVRWPLALLSDYYHWQTNSFSSCAQTAWGPLLSRTPFDDFMQNIAKPLGLDLNITVNYGSNDSCTAGGDPNEAASWVDYANNQKHYGIKYWDYRQRRVLWRSDVRHNFQHSRFQRIFQRSAVAGLVNVRKPRGHAILSFDEGKGPFHSDWH